jgi:uncharacterized protein (TIGR02145 family)
MYSRLKKIVMLLLVTNGLYRIGQAQNVLIDPRDGMQYQIVKINSQVWMAENMKYVADSIAHFYNPYAKEHTTKIYVLRSSDFQTVPEYNTAVTYCYSDIPYQCKKYGMIYSWVAAQKTCPVGWHLPSKEDFDQLLLTVGGGDKKKVYTALTASDSVGFKALLGGYFSGGANNKDSKQRCYFSGSGKSVGFWTSTTKHKKDAKEFSMGYGFAGFSNDYRSSGNYVRCIKD